MDLETIRQYLSQYRIKNDVRLEKMSSDIGISVGSLWKFLNEAVKPNERTKYKIEKYLEENGVSIDI